jgi:hypothetical protein
VTTRRLRFRTVRGFRNTLIGLVAAVMLLVLTAPTSTATGVPGAAGTDTALPATDSAVTVAGRGAFDGLRVTVNQSRDLVNQAVSVTWSGAAATTSNPVRFGADYLQILQCWGEDDGSDPTNPGPPPEQCVQGATDGVYGGLSSSNFPPGLELTRIISRTGWANDAEMQMRGVGYSEAATGYRWRPFRAVDGTVVDAHVDHAFNPVIVGGNYWLNPYFNVYTTNEVAAAVTGPDGRGSEMFQVATGLESTGLGCGQRVQPVAGGSPKIPKCWIVVVPRGTAAAENVGTPFADRAEQFGVVTSPLSPSAWQNRIAIPLEFKPVDTSCSLDAKDRRIVGSELVVPAITSWQSTLCATAGLPPYTYGTVPDAAARAQIASPAAGAPGMAITSRPLDAGTVTSSNPVVYAPVSASGVVIGFNLEREPSLGAPSGELALRGVRVAQMNLTPRLVAKLLTQSYASQIAILGAPPASATWIETNPSNLASDPDFLRFNPEFELLRVANSKSFSGLVLPARNSDTARQVWAWILADPEAKSWLDGNADQWGMNVNPVYSTNASVNPSHAAFADPVPESFPKSDPYCLTRGPIAGPGSVVPPALCGTDWMPYMQSMRDAAVATRTADDGAKTTENAYAATADQFWKRSAPQTAGSRAMLSLTDSASAARYGLQVARLTRAGDDGSARAFVAPDSEGLTAGITAMAPVSDPAVLEPVPTASMPGAYPLTALSYAAVRPLDLDAAARNDYAAFLDYAAGSGQVTGLGVGQLPMGYAPLPAVLESQTSAAAELIRTMQAPVPSADNSSGDTGSYPTYPSRTSSGSSGSAKTPVAVVAPPATTTVTPTEELGALTPVVALARNRFIVPILGGLALFAALMALEITKRPRRVRSTVRRRS